MARENGEPYHSWDKEAFHLIREGVYKSTRGESEPHDSECAVAQKETYVDHHENETNII